MKTDDPYSPPNAVEKSASAKQVAVPDSLFSAIKRGVWLGGKWVTFTVGPIAAFMCLVAMASAIWTLFMRNGATGFADPVLNWVMARQLVGPIGAYLVSCIWGGIAGSVICSVQYGLSKTRSTESQS